MQVNHRITGCPYFRFRDAVYRNRLKIPDAELINGLRGAKAAEDHAGQEKKDAVHGLAGLENFFVIKDRQSVLRDQLSPGLAMCKEIFAFRL
jgi:hypothetical protein